MSRGYDTAKWPPARAAYPPFSYGGNGIDARIGLIFMASSIAMESEMQAMVAPGVAVHTARITLPKVTVAGIEEMMTAPELETAARHLASAPIDVLCFGGTSASFLHGTSYDLGLIEKLKAWAPGKKITTASTATLAALRKMKAGKVALVTPYAAEVQERAIRFLGENGHEVVANDHLNITKDQELAEVPLEKVFDMVCAVDRPDASAIFISCTNFWSVPVIAALEAELKKPVISAVQASFWHCLELTGVKGARPGYGALLDDHLATKGEAL